MRMKTTEMFHRKTHKRRADRTKASHLPTEWFISLSVHVVVSDSLSDSCFTSCHSCRSVHPHAAQVHLFLFLQSDRPGYMCLYVRCGFRFNGQSTRWLFVCVGVCVRACVLAQTLIIYEYMYTSQRV